MQIPLQSVSRTARLPEPKNPLRSFRFLFKSAAKSLQISYKDGQLSIIAEDCPLSDIMKALRTALKMDVDLPAGGTQQRVWVHLGPGPARRVLRDLLDSTEFNYVIQAAEDTDDGIRSILLTPRSKSGPEEPAGRPEVAANRRNPRGAPADDAPETEPANVANAESAVPAATATSDATAAVAPPSSSGSPRVAPVLGQDLSNADASSAAGASTGDRMIQQLQSMYQQRRQIQMQQNQRNSTSVPNQ